MRAASGVALRAVLPVLVFRKSAPESRLRREARRISGGVQQHARLQNHLARNAGHVGDYALHFVDAVGYLKFCEGFGYGRPFGWLP